ncbi:MAG: DUF2029 domain-containing protein [Pedobacter sp.]|nr:MAG: DUF2029 domain-containing protein [Pedobacter sp.]
MSLLGKKNFSLGFLRNPNFLLILWTLICAIASFKQYAISDALSGKCAYNNFRVFIYSFKHLLAHQNLYGAYPAEYFDLYHYGPIFALLIAPFYYLPIEISLILWGALNAWCLFKAIWSLPLDSHAKAAIIWISTNTLITSTLNSQFHAICVAMIILSYTYIVKKKDILGTLFIVLGAFIKLYGIVGLAFFFFSKSKKHFILWSLIWTIAIFILPMLFCKLGYIIQTYIDWYTDLIHKNGSNSDITQTRLDVCVMGMVRRITHNGTLSNLYYILPALFVMAISYFRFKLHRQVSFQLAVLASLLLFIILASTGSESPTYIIAFPGVGIWYILEKKKNILVISLLIITLLISSFSPTDLFPRSIRINYLEPYALMALPVFLVWLRLNYLMLTNQLNQVNPIVPTQAPNS